MSRQESAVAAPSFPDWKVKAVDSITVTLGRVIKYGACVWIARYGYLAVVALAGRQTLASIGIKLLANITLSQTFAWTATGGASLWAASERRLRKKIIRQKAARIQQLESYVDKKRSSSSLTEDGLTRPEDYE